MPARSCAAAAAAAVAKADAAAAASEADNLELGRPSGSVHILDWSNRNNGGIAVGEFDPPRENVACGLDAVRSLRACTRSRSI